jgi:TnpA family transposase
LRDACSILLDPAVDDADIRAAVFAQISRERLVGAITQVDGLAHPPEDTRYAELQGRYRTVRRWLPTLLHTLTFGSTAAGQPVQDALTFLAAIESSGRLRSSLMDAPQAVIRRAWVPLVVRADGTIDSMAYTFCVLEALQDALSRRDLFVAPSMRYADPRIGLLHGGAWEVARPHVVRALGRDTTPEGELDRLAQQLDTAYHTMVANLPTNADVRIETRQGTPTLLVSGLDALAEPSSLVALRDAVAARLPRVDLPEVLLEIHALTRFADAFTHISEADARADNLPTSICAVLLSEACNIGLEPLVRADIPALTRGRLAWVQQNYIRAETLARANARLVAAQARIPIVQLWGGGDVASADGLRFVVPVRTINAASNPKYFGAQRGITYYYNLMSDYYTGLHGVVVTGTLKDSLTLLSVVSEQQTQLQPTEIMTDTGAYADIIFGLFWLLGYQFSPRLADVGDTRFWRIDPQADYGPFNQLGRHKINTNIIAQNWDDFLRLAGSLHLGTAQVGALMRTLQKGGTPSRLARALQELGRIIKTLYLLPYLDDATYRRRILTQLNRHESRHNLARAVFHGQRGEVRQRYREGQEDQLGALGLVVNMITLWNTRYMDAVIGYLQRTGSEVRAEDVARLSPLGREHINLLGRYSFMVSESIRRGHLRPLRDPSAPDI